MKAVIIVKPEVSELFPMTTGFGKPVVEAVAAVSADLEKRVGVQKEFGALIFAGETSRGFLDVKRLDIKGILPWYGVTLYPYSEFISRINQKYQDGDLLVVAVDDRSADDICNTLAKCRYDVQLEKNS